MILKRSASALGILQVALALVDSDGDFTLVQYISSRFCSSDQYVCQPLSLGQCTHLKAFGPHGAQGQDVYAKLQDATAQSSRKSHWTHAKEVASPLVARAACW